MKGTFSMIFIVKRIPHLWIQSFQGILVISTIFNERNPKVPSTLTGENFTPKVSSTLIVKKFTPKVQSTLTGKKSLPLKSHLQ